MQKILKEKWNAVVIVVILVAFFSGMHVGANNPPEVDNILLANKETQAGITADFSSFWKAWNTINEKYPGADEIKDQEKIYGAISGLVESLNDPYSVFFTPRETKLFKEEITGNFSGVGMEVSIKNKTLTVVAPLKNTPAYRANIKPGDKIIKIDDRLTSGITIDEAVGLMRGERGTTVVLTLVREGVQEPIEVKIIRDTINIPTLDTELRKDGIFVIKLYSFTSKSPELFRNAIKKFYYSKSNKMILDLRGNPGGYLNSAIDITSWFLPGGKTIVTEDYGDRAEPEIFRSKGYKALKDDLKLIVLIDNGSASASEILAGALQDYKRGKLLGTKSFGKGSVQELIQITPDTAIKITVAKWLTPNGNTIAEKGLTPDYLVEPTAKDIAEKKDAQLEKAVELLNSVNF